VNVLRATLVALTLLLALYTVGCGGDDDKNPVSPPPSADVTINISGQNGANSYTPSNATITSGQRVAWHNSDATIHTATADNGTTFNTGNIAPGGTSAAIQINNAGTFGYHCTIHPSMIDTLIVQP
jgi:plastocyanin